MGKKTGLRKQLGRHASNQIYTEVVVSEIKKKLDPSDGCRESLGVLLDVQDKEEKGNENDIKPVNHSNKKDEHEKWR